MIDFFLERETYKYVQNIRDRHVHDISGREREREIEPSKDIDEPITISIASCVESFVQATEASATTAEAGAEAAPAAGWRCWQFAGRNMV